jgi:hypothetical protein
MISFVAELVGVQTPGFVAELVRVQTLNSHEFSYGYPERGPP